MAVDYYIAQDTLYTGSLSLDEGSLGVLTYKSIQQLYYSNFTSGSIGSTGTNNTASFDNFIETSFTSGSRQLGETAVVFSLPNKMVGTHVEPLTFRIGSEVEFILDQEDYVQVDYLYKGEPIIDDGEGNLRESSITGRKVGNIIYSHGQVIITDETLATYFIELVNASGSLDLPMSWKSNQPIYTYNYNIKISDYEYNFTFNPTARSGSDGQLADNVTGSYFQPYITTVGLYNDSNELIAVAKLAQPLPKSANTEMTIQVKLDI
jgi:hypothetical protein